MAARSPTTLGTFFWVVLFASGCQHRRITGTEQKETRPSDGASEKAAGDSATSEAGTLDLLRSALTAIDSHKTPSETALLLPGKLTITENKGWWRVIVSDPTIVVTLGQGGRDQEIGEIEIHLPIAALVRLRDVKGLFGDYKTVFESKTSSVRFSAPAARGITVHADLLSSRVLPDAPVTAVTLRRHL